MIGVAVADEHFRIRDAAQDVGFLDVCQSTTRNVDINSNLNSFLEVDTVDRKSIRRTIRSNNSLDSDLRDRLKLDGSYHVNWSPSADFALLTGSARLDCSTVV